MEAKHTESPWCVATLGGGHYRVETHTHTEVFEEDENGQQCEWAQHSIATARLIAAAPELLKTLHYIEGLALAEELRNLPTIAQAARAAITKATSANADQALGA